jgi:AcrR family transcriptional regulator
MVRPKDADSEETWNRIIAAARQELVDDEGNIDVSLRQVALTSGTSLGTIHYYFPTKESLLEACLEAYYVALAELAGDLAERTGRCTRETAREVIDDCLRRIYRFALSERPRLRLRAATNTQRGRLHPLRDEHVRGPYLDWFTPIIERLVDVSAGEVRMAIQTMSFVVMHYVLLCDAELEQIVGVRGDAGRRIVEDHVVRAGMRLVFKGCSGIVAQPLGSSPYHLSLRPVPSPSPPFPSPILIKSTNARSAAGICLLLG